MNNFTKVKWSASPKRNSVVSTDSSGLSFGGAAGDDAIKYYGGNLIGESISSCNIPLIASSGNTAVELAGMGYDAQGVIEILPAMIRKIKQLELAGYNEVEELEVELFDLLSGKESAK